MPVIEVRRAGVLDTRPMAELLNEIIAAGGTTAITDPVTPEALAEHLQTGIRNAWHIAEDSTGLCLGFQWIEQIDTLPPEAASIATFARRGHTRISIGSSLFDETRDAAHALGYRWINAEICADNQGGLIYYQSRGFADYGRKRGFRLADGTTIDKMLKRYDL